MTSRRGHVIKGAGRGAFIVDRCREFVGIVVLFVAFCALRTPTGTTMPTRPHGFLGKVGWQLAIITLLLLLLGIIVQKI